MTGKRWMIMTESEAAYLKKMDAWNESTMTISKKIPVPGEVLTPEEIERLVVCDNGHRSMVRENLLREKGYTPFCGADQCRMSWPRTFFVRRGQFVCPACGWVSSFPLEFIEKYREQWCLP